MIPRRAIASLVLLLPLAVLAAGGGSDLSPGDGIGPDVTADLAALPHYAPGPVPFPKGASYLAPDGAITVVGYNDMREMLEAIDRLFQATHPGFRFHLVLKGTKTAPPALARGLSAFAPMGAEFTDDERAYFGKTTGTEPVLFRVAHDSITPRALSSPQGIFVNRANPLGMLTTDQVARIFTIGQAGGDLTAWRELGLTGAWAGLPIHPTGPGPDTAIAIFMRRHKFGNHPYARGLIPFHESDDVIRRIGEDPLAIGFASLCRPTPLVKVVAIDRMDGRPAVRGSARDIISGSYPYDRHLLIYARRPTAGSLDPFVREYLRLVLSREGQEAVARCPQHYLPLNPDDLRSELAKLDP